MRIIVFVLILLIATIGAAGPRPHSEGYCGAYRDFLNEAVYDANRSIHWHPEQAPEGEWRDGLNFIYENRHRGQKLYHWVESEYQRCKKER